MYCSFDKNCEIDLEDCAEMGMEKEESSKQQETLFLDKGEELQLTSVSQSPGRAARKRASNK